MKPWVLKVISTELRKILAYRSDFWINFLGQMLIQLFIARALWSAVFAANGVSEMRGLTLDKMTLYYLLAPLIMKTMMGENIGFLAREIYDGGINRYLVWPLKALQYKSLTFMTYSIFYLLQLNLMYLVARFFFDPVPYALADFQGALMGSGLILLASYTYFYIMSLCEMVAFWADNTWTLSVMLRFVASFLGGAFLPLSFFPETLVPVLKLLPFQAMISTPVNLYLGRASGVEALEAALTLLFWLPVLYGMSRLMWRKASYHYTGVGM